MPARQGKSKEKYKIHVTMRDFYKFYKDTYFKLPRKPINYDSKYYMTQREYGNIQRDFCKIIMEKMVQESWDFKMPCSLGIIGIRKKKKKVYTNPVTGEKILKLSVDWDATLQLWERDPEAKRKKSRVFYQNKHSKGYSVRVFWFKSNTRVRNKSAYKWRTTRNFNKYLADELRKPGSKLDYYML